MSDIPADQHFARYSKRTHIVERDGNRAISSSNFLLREKEEYLSGAWYEFWKPLTEEDAIQKATDFMLTKGFRKVNGAFSLHKVENILAKSNERVKYAVRHLGAKDAYSGVFPQPATLCDAEAIAETVNKVLFCVEQPGSIQ